MNILANIAEEIAANKNMKIDDLADKFGVNRRTMQNYIHNLKTQCSDFKSTPGPNGGINFYGKDNTDFSFLNKK